MHLLVFTHILKSCLYLLFTCILLCCLICRIICIVSFRPVYPDIANLLRCLAKVSRDQETCSVLTSPKVWCRQEKLYKRIFLLDNFPRICI
jgi:hypothetical protein